MKNFLGLWSALVLLCVTWTPLVASEEGVASYYADALQRNATASGEPYDRNDLTAAHRTLDFGTMVRVTNVESGESVVVRIIDRGPHVESRIIDVSGVAAEKLGMLDAGEAKVTIEVVQ